MTAPNSKTTANPPNTEPAAPNRKKNSQSLWLWIFRSMMAIAVAAALFYTIKKSSNEFANLEFRLTDIRLIWIFAAIASYWVAMFLSCEFWRRILLALNCAANRSKTVLAFFVSQLGKYVPGKAMVVLLRTEMIRGPKTNVAAAAASVFVETLTWIFVGSLIACALIFVRYPDQVGLQWTAAALALAAGIATWPSIFRSLASRLTRQSPDLFAGLNLSTMATGWGLMSTGWCFNALSLCFILTSLPGTDFTVADFPLALACVSLATVAGFASLLPGGIGVRELVMIPLLGPRFGEPIAIIAAILIRLVWISAEVVGSVIIYLWHRSQNGRAAQPN